MCPDHSTMQPLHAPGDAAARKIQAVFRGWVARMTARAKILQKRLVDIELRQKNELREIQVWLELQMAEVDALMQQIHRLQSTPVRPIVDDLDTNRKVPIPVESSGRISPVQRSDGDAIFPGSPLASKLERSQRKTNECHRTRLSRPAHKCKYLSIEGEESSQLSIC